MGLPFYGFAILRLSHFIGLQRADTNPAVENYNFIIP